MPYGSELKGRYSERMLMTLVPNISVSESNWTKKPVNEYSSFIYVKNICLELLSTSIFHAKFYSGNYGESINA